MGAPRRYTDDQLAEAIRTSHNWSQVMRKIGKRGVGGNRASVRLVTERLGLETSHLNGVLALNAPLPFSQPATHRPTVGLASAAKWFLDRGYVVSLPIEPAVYDLVVESDDGLKKVQVKTTSQTRGGSEVVVIARVIYDASRTRTAAGQARRIAYEQGMIDFFFVVSSSGRNYLIPQVAVNGRLSINLTRKYQAFEI